MDAGLLDDEVELELEPDLSELDDELADFSVDDDFSAACPTTSPRNPTSRRRHRSR